MPRPTEHWDLSELNDFCAQGTKESSNLDWKRGDALANQDKSKNELAKDVTAMANANGGIIVYGIAERKGGYADHLHGSDAAITSSWIDQILNSSIEPRIAGIKIKEIALPDSSKAFVIDVPKGHTAHQAKAYRQYFRRYNEESLPMLDHEIRDVMGRATSPILFTEWEFQDAASDANQWLLRIRIGNKSEAVSLYTAVQFTLDQELQPTEISKPFQQDHFLTLLLGGVEHPTINFSQNLAVPHHMPIFKGVNFTVFSANVIVEDAKIYPVRYKVSAPGFLEEGLGTIYKRGDSPFAEF